MGPQTYDLSAVGAGDDRRRKKKKKKRRKEVGQQEGSCVLKHQSWLRYKNYTGQPKILCPWLWYEAAARQLNGGVKEYGGIHDNPLSRFLLRKEARKRIGDTGLLDHLLKHLAGKVVPPDGKDRLRRCDADGKMEYWLEDDDLANLRKEAGVNDPGWKLGDSINSPDCNCRKEIKTLKDELYNMRRCVIGME